MFAANYGVTVSLGGARTGIKLWEGSKRPGESEKVEEWWAARCETSAGGVWTAKFSLHTHKVHSSPLLLPLL